MPRAHHVPAEGVVAYQYVLLDPQWTEDKWIQQAEVRPEIVRWYIISLPSSCPLRRCSR